MKILLFFRKLVYLFFLFIIDNEIARLFIRSLFLWLGLNIVSGMYLYFLSISISDLVKNGLDLVFFGKKVICIKKIKSPSPDSSENPFLRLFCR